MDCRVCGRTIPAGRLAALPDTRVCVNCSEEQAKVAVTVWHDKTPMVLVMTPEEAARHWKLEKIDGRMERL